MNIRIGQKMRVLRKQKGFSQEQIADYIHTTQSTYARIENGIGNSWVNYILPLCELFGVELEEFFRSESENIGGAKKGSRRFDELNIINELSGRLIEQYEKRIFEKDMYITELKAEVEMLRRIVGGECKINVNVNDL
ncbi:helix-turn-helix transcriptional regulator [Capnocytophaga stomatis]|uniref:Transcriptional regulator n=1 Tax=Capnocytophaga stomatis TaxID=1848904 RepID=A0A250FZ92_9FLAO|nr:helix-turn-helix transcriptional regulator [Capnocytophaga stomatis]ATA90452.1 transcriptional regulator [Capnocytophaga stomatis]